MKESNEDDGKSQVGGYEIRRGLLEGQMEFDFRDEWSRLKGINLKMLKFFDRLKIRLCYTLG